MPQRSSNDLSTLPNFKIISQRSPFNKIGQKNFAPLIDKPSAKKKKLFKSSAVLYRLKMSIFHTKIAYYQLILHLNN